MQRPHIVILGAGFGGMHVAHRLARLVKQGRIDVTVVNRTNYFLFTPLLHEVATGSLSPRSVAEPLREVFVKSGIRVIQGTVDSIDAQARTVAIHGSLDKITVEYDYLVVATGAETNYYGIPGAEEHTLPLKDLKDAARIRNRIIDVFEQAILAQDPEERRRLLSFAVVGGGATGVETAAELSEFVAGLVKRYYGNTAQCDPHDGRHCRPEESMISLIHMGPEVLEQFKPSLRQAAARRLERNGVTLRLSSTVASVTRDSLALKVGVPVMASTVIWAAGVRALVPHFEGTPPSLSGGRLAVDQYFRLLGQDRVFALGDAAAYVDTDAPASPDGKPAKPVPQLAQAAVAEAKTVAGNILASLSKKPLRTFHYHSKGTMVSVGQWFAIGEIFSLNIAGRLTWWLWRTVYLFKFSSWPKRIQIAFEWTLELFYPRDITKL